MLRGHDGSQTDTRTYHHLFPLDIIKMFCFYDFALILSMAFSCYQSYSVSTSEGKLIPNSVLFISSFHEFCT